MLLEVEKCLWKVGNANIKQGGEGMEVDSSRGDGEDERGRAGDNGEGGARVEGDGATGGGVTKAGV